MSTMVLNSYYRNVDVYRMSDREYREYRRAKAATIRLQHMIARAFLIIVLAITFSFIFHGTATKASVKAEDVKYKYFKQITVSAGDTWESIAQEYMDEDYYTSAEEYIQENIQMNGFDSDRLLSGQIIMISYYDDVYIK